MLIHRREVVDLWSEAAIESVRSRLLQAWAERANVSMMAMNSITGPSRAYQGRRSDQRWGPW